MKSFWHARPLVAAAAGSSHNLALRDDGSVVAWGRNDLGQTNMPGSPETAIAISAGGQQSLSLNNNGTVKQWGLTNANVPAGLVSVSAIASGTNFHLALKTNGTVVAWGAGAGTNIPAGLSNVVAIAAAGEHALALKQDGKVVAWGTNVSGESTVPTGLSNVMAVAAGRAHSLALHNDATVVAWGYNTYGQTNVVSGLPPVKLLSAGSDHSLAVTFSQLTQYNVDVSKDLLLIYNTNSVDSSNVCLYYLNHRPMVSRANVLGAGTTNAETFLPAEFTNSFVPQVLQWISNNPTRHPQYVILFLGIPSRINSNPTNPYAKPFFGSSVSVALNQRIVGIPPYVTCINMSNFGDCTNYISKLERFGAAYSSGKLFIGAHKGGYSNTNYCFDVSGYCPTTNCPDLLDEAAIARSGVLDRGAPSAAIIYSGTSGQHVTAAMNVTGYLSMGTHGWESKSFPLDGEVTFLGDSGWYLIGTVESYNGRWWDPDFSTYNMWFASAAFGGTAYTNTPAGAICHVDEPGWIACHTDLYFGLWEARKAFAICAWYSHYNTQFQTVGDPFIIK